MTSPATRSPAEIALIFPPLLFNRFHGPYVALPHLAAYLEAQGVRGVELLDANLLALNRLTSPAYLEELLEEIERSLARAREPGAVKHLLHQKYVVAYALEDGRRLRTDRMAFLLLATVVLDLYYGRVEKTVAGQIARLDDLGIGPISAAVEETIGRLDRSVRLVGIGVPTADQLLSALMLAREARRKLGDGVHLTLGGGVLSLCDERQLAEILATGYVDSVVRHEGEKPLLALCRHVHGELGLGDVPNLCFLEDGRLRATPVVEPVPLDECPAPRFAATDEEAYGEDLVLPVWAARGCYWGKCTFCDYVHLSGSARKCELRSVDRLLDVVESHVARYGASSFELVADCLPARHVDRLCAEIRKRRLEIRWSTHLRVEKAFTDGLCRRMRAAGCREVNFGVESSCERILRLIDKGNGPSDAVSVLSSMRGAGIDTIINIIVGFPSATLDELRETLAWLERHRSLYTTLQVHPFVLSRLSPIAANPSRFGLSLQDAPDVRHHRGFNCVRFTRVAGATDGEVESMAEAYVRTRQVHARRVRQEGSLRTLEQEPLASLEVRPEPRFLFLSGSEKERVARLLELAAPDEGAECLAFDLECKTVNACPSAMEQVHRALPAEWIPATELGEAIRADGATDAECAASLRDVLRCGICLGLLAVRNPAVENAVQRRPYDESADG